MADYSIEAELKANAGKFRRAIQAAKRVTQDFKRTSESVEDTELDADISPLKRNMRKAKALMNAFRKSKAEPDIGADTSDFKRKAALVAEKSRDLEDKTIIVTIEAHAKRFRKTIVKIQNRMDTLANSIRTFGTVAGSFFRGLGLAASSAAVPIIASLVPAIMAAGNAIGVLVGASAGLLSSFTALAGAGGAFAIAAIGNASKLTESMKEIDKLNEKIQKERESLDPNMDKINGLLHERSVLLSKLSDEQIAAQKQLKSFRQGWDEFLSATEKPVFQVFAAGLEVATSLLHELKPIIQPVSDALTVLLNKFNDFSKGEQFRSFIDFFAGRGTEAILSWGEIAGNIMTGFMELMKAFGPTAASMEEGLIAMTQRFEDWATALRESKGFQKFVQYVQTNMPIIRQIFGDVFKGIINLFASFGDNSAIIFNALAEMAAKFKAWSETVKQSDGFQKFIAYVQENGPKVVSLIGNVIDFIIQLGVALAPMGERMLEIINRVISFTTALMKNHPWIGKVIGILTVLAGSLMAVTPILIALQTAFGGFVGKMILGFAKLIGKVIAWSVTTIGKLVAVIAKWAWAGVKATLHAAKVAAAWTLATGKRMVVAVAKMIATAVLFVARWAAIAAGAVLNAAIVAGAWALSTGAAMAKAAAKMIATAAIFVARWAFMGVQALLHAGKMAAAWFIALGPIGWVTAAVIALAALIIANWGKVSSWTKKAWSAVWNWIKETWNKVWGKTKEIASSIASWVSRKFTETVNVVRESMSAAKKWVADKWSEAKSAAVAKLKEIVSSVVEFFAEVVNAVESKLSDAVAAVAEFIGKMPGEVLSFVGDMVDAGADLVGGVISGIQSKIKEGLGVIGGLATSLINRFKKDTETKSPSRAFARISQWFPAGVAKGIKDKKKVALNAVKGLATDVTDSFNPSLQMKSAQITSSLRGLKRKSTAQVNSAVNTEVELNNRQPAYINLNIGGRNYKAFVDDLTTEQEREVELDEEFKG